MGGSLKPMLAHEFKKHKHKVKYPCIVQPKLDGIRCIATIKDGKCTLRTRTGNVINSVPHINVGLENEYRKDIIFDGELKSHTGDFDHTSSIVRRKEPKMDGSHFFIDYHIFDIICYKTPTLDRLIKLGNISDVMEFVYVKFVRSEIAEWESRVTALLYSAEEQGYEGVMIRDTQSLYENKRSFSLLKLKSFQDEEFEVWDVIEGKGKLKGKAGAFRCGLASGEACFRVKMACEESQLEEYLVNAHKYIGKQLTVQFQGKTKRGIPRFPIGLRFREEV